MLVKFEQNLMVQTKQNFEVFQKKENVLFVLFCLFVFFNYFWQSVGAILIDNPVAETIV